MVDKADKICTSVCLDRDVRNLIKISGYTLLEAVMFFVHNVVLNKENKLIYNRNKMMKKINALEKEEKIKLDLHGWEL